MNDAGHPLLARACFPLEEDGGIGGGGLLHLFFHARPLGRKPPDEQKGFLANRASEVGSGPAQKFLRESHDFLQGLQVAVVENVRTEVENTQNADDLALG